MHFLLLLAATVASAQPMTTEGSRTAKVVGLPPTGQPYTITNSFGGVAVTCGSGTEAVAEVTYSMPGAPLLNKSVTDQIQPVATKKDGKPVELKVNAPSTLPDGSVIGLKITLPAAGVITVVGGDGALSVTSCKGSLAAANVKGDVNIDGAYTQVTVEAPDGGLVVTLGQDTLAKSSTLSAPNGNITVSMPTLNANVSAKADKITVSMPTLTVKPGVNEFTNQKLNEGGALLNITTGKNLVIK
jgi:hypothetical protein